MASLPVKNRITHRQESPWAMMVASAAPRTPMCAHRMSMGSSTMLVAAPSTTVIMPTRPKPWALMKGFMPRLIITNSVPQR